MAYFQPLIASSFDALNNQRMGWEGFNARVQAENIARANAAEANQNNWLANVAQMRYAAMNRDLALAERERNLGASLAEARRRDALIAASESARLGLSKEQLKSQQDFEREQAKTKMDYEREMFEKQTKLANEQLDITAQHIAANYGPAREAATTAEQQYADIQGKILDQDNIVARVAAKGTRATKEELAQAAAARNLSTELKKQIGRFERERNAAQRVVAGLETKAYNARLTINKDGTIVHPQSQKTWKWSTALKEAKADIGTPLDAATAKWGGAFRSFGADQVAEPIDETATVPATAAAAPARIGRFTVVAE